MRTFSKRPPTSGRTNLQRDVEGGDGLALPAAGGGTRTTFAEMVVSNPEAGQTEWNSATNQTDPVVGKSN